MLCDNLVTLRNLKGLSQEQIAEIIGISRQAYAKWEQGETVPDVEKCDKLSHFYGVTVDALLHQNNRIGTARVAPAPIGKHLFGTVTVGGKGQIVIPKEARDVFELKEGDKLVVLGDENEGIALVRSDDFEKRMQLALSLGRVESN